MRPNFQIILVRTNGAGVLAGTTDRLAEWLLQTRNNFHCSSPMAQRTIWFMLFRLRFALLLPLAALLACGSTSPFVGGGAFPAGDYVIVVAPGAAGTSTLAGALTVQGTSVTGVFRYTNPGTVCVSNGQDIPFAGSISNGVLTLTSGSFAGGAATLTLQPILTNNTGAQVGSGTAVIAGGTCALASSSVQTQYIPSFAGTWSSTLTGPATGTASIVFTESGANADGQFPATGSITFTSPTQSTCNFSVPGSAPISGLVNGATLQVTNSSSSVTMTANAAGQAITLNVAFNVTGSPSGCLGNYTGTLTH